MDKYLIPWDKTDWSPRIGLAWEAIDRTVVRAGYGIFYGGEENQGGNPNRGEGVPFNQDQRFSPPNDFALIPNLGKFSDGFPVNAFTLPASISFRSIAPNFRNPLVHKWNLAIQRELGFNTSLEVAYIGSKGSRLVVLWNPNQAVNAPDPAADTNSRRRFPFIASGFDATASFGFSKYHGLATKLEKTFSNGLQFLTSYTWSHALTNVGTTLAGGFAPRDVTNFTQEYAHANYHIKNRFVHSMLWDLPFGRGQKFGSSMNSAANAILGNWQANAIITLQSGPAFNLGTAERELRVRRYSPPRSWWQARILMMPRRADGPRTFGSIPLLSQGPLPAPTAIWATTPFTVQEHVTWTSRCLRISRSMSVSGSSSEQSFSTCLTHPNSTETRVWTKPRATAASAGLAAR